MGASPRLNWAIFAASTSTQATSTPNSAKQAPVTSPTYPEPTTAMCIQLVCSKRFVTKHTGHALQRVTRRLHSSAAHLGTSPDRFELVLPRRTYYRYAAAEIEIVIT